MEQFLKLPMNILENRYMETYIRNSLTFQMAQFSNNLPFCLETTFFEIIKSIEDWRIIISIFRDTKNLNSLLINKINKSGLLTYQKDQLADELDYTSNPFLPRDYQTHKVPDRKKAYSEFLDKMSMFNFDENQHFQTQIKLLKNQIKDRESYREGSFLKLFADRDSEIKKRRIKEIDDIETKAKNHDEDGLHKYFDIWFHIQEDQSKLFDQLIDSNSDVNEAIERIHQLLSNYFFNDDFEIVANISKEQVFDILVKTPLIINQVGYWSSDYFVNQLEYLLDKLKLINLNTLINNTIGLIEEVIPIILNSKSYLPPEDFPSFPLYFNDFVLSRWTSLPGFRISLRIFHTKSWDELSSSYFGEGELRYPVPFTLARLEGKSITESWFETIKQRNLLLYNFNDRDIIIPEFYQIFTNKLSEENRLQECDLSEYLLFVMIETNAITYDYGDVDNDTYLQNLSLFDDSQCGSYCSQTSPIYTENLHPEFIPFTSSYSLLGALSYTKMMNYVFNHSLYSKGLSEEEVIIEIRKTLAQLYVVPVESNNESMYAVLSQKNYSRIKEYREKQVGYDQLLAATKIFSPTNLNQKLAKFQNEINHMNQYFETLIDEIQYINQTPGGVLVQVLSLFQEYQSLTRMEIIEKLIDQAKRTGDPRADRTLYDFYTIKLKEEDLQKLVDQKVLTTSRENPGKKGPAVYRYHYIGKINSHTVS